MAADGAQPIAAAVRVERYVDSDHAWDAFIRATPGGTFFHLLGWRTVLESSFGFRTHYLVARRGERIAGVLPLCELKQPFSGRCLMSLPFAVEAGICAADVDTQRALETAAVDLGRVLGAAYVELRDGLDGGPFTTRSSPYFRFRRGISANDDDNLNAVPRKQRRMIRVGMQNCLSARVGDDFDAFYDVYARSVRRLGTPVFARSYFEALRHHFAEDSLILTVWHGDTPVAVVLSFFFGDAVLPYYAGSRLELRHLAANDYMYWELMRTAVRRGARVFDFGRSKQDTGAFAFKRHWGFEPEPLRYRTYSSGDPQARSLNDAPVAFLRQAWSRLPLWATKLAGPAIVRRLGPFYT